MAEREIKPIYVFYGDDQFRLRNDVSRFRNYFKNAGIVPEEFMANKTTPSDIVETASEFSLFGSRRFLIVDECTWFATKPKKDSEKSNDEKNKATGLTAAERDELNLKVLQDYLENPNNDTCILFVCRTVDKRKKVTKAAEKSGVVREYNTQKKSELDGFIRSQLALNQKKISRNNGEFLKQWCGEDSGILANEIAKIAIAIGNKEWIEESDIRSYSTPSPTASVFDVADALNTRNIREIKRTLLLAYDGMKDSDFYMLFGFMVNHIRLLIRVYDLASRGKKQGEIATILKIHPFRIQKAMTAVSRYSMAELCLGYHMLLECDYEIKNGQGEPRDTLLVVLLKIAQQHS